MEKKNLRESLADGDAILPNDGTLGKTANLFRCESVETTVSFMELNDTKCRWPLDLDGGGERRYCGKKVAGFPYCGAHASIAYNAPARRMTAPRY